MARSQSSGVAVVMLLVAGVTALSWVALARQAMGWSPAASKAPIGEHVQVGGAQGLVQPGPVDIGFVQDMALHHEQALVMARLALSRGSPRVQVLAQGILDQQLRELGLMQGWLMLWGALMSSRQDDMAWMRKAYARSPLRDPDYDWFIENCLRGKGMPGMATAGQLEALAEMSSQATFDRAFLLLMVRHHQSAVVMARFAAQHASMDAVRGLARSVVAEQQQELGQMIVWSRASSER